MTVYVDDASIHASVPNGRRVHTSDWCHMMADSVSELDAFAQNVLGLRREWRQNKRSGVHYDLTAPKTRLALRSGAQLIVTRSPEWMRVHEAAKLQYWAVCPMDEYRKARSDWRTANFARLFSHDEIVARTAEAEFRRIFGNRLPLDN